MKNGPYPLLFPHQYIEAWPEMDFKHDTVFNCYTHFWTKIPLISQIQVRAGETNCIYCAQQ